MSLHLAFGRRCAGKSVVARLMAKAEAIKAGRAVFRVSYVRRNGARVEEELGANGEPVIDVSVARKALK